MSSLQTGKPASWMQPATAAKGVRVAFLFGGIATSAILGSAPHMAAAANETTPAAGVSSAGPTSARTPSDAWRYRYHAGRWWYWLPSESWAWHDGRRWIAYEPSTTRRVAAILVQRPTRNGDPERYRSGTSPAPPATFEELRGDIEELKQTVKQLESRLEGAYARGPVQPTYEIDRARLNELWRARQDAIRFYDLGSDAYYFSGKGHFTD